MIWVAAALALAGLAALPFAIEARKRPVDPQALVREGGEIAPLRHGATWYRWHGDGPGPVLVLVHGLSTPSWVFSGLTDGLAAMGFRVLRYDLYGRGRSARPAAVHDRALFTAQLGGLLDHLGIDEPVTLLGYSMGGAIATCFAAEHPGRVARLILLAPAGMAYAPAPLLARAARWGLVGDWLWLLAGGRHLCRGARAEAPRATAIPDLAERIAREVATRGYLPAILSSERHMLTELLEAEHRQIHDHGLPVLAIWGARDTVIPPPAISKLTEWNRRARHVVVPDASHALGYTHPAQVLAALKAEPSAP